MKCPYCKMDNNRVESHYRYGNDKSESFYRYRRCLSCDKAFKTVESYVPDEELHKVNKKKIEGMPERFKKRNVARGYK